MGLGLVTYADAFRSLTGMFNQLARFIDSASGANDALGNWISQLADYWSINGFSISRNLLTTTLVPP